MEILNTESFKTKVYDFDKNTDWKFAGTKPAILDFFAEWCGPCKRLAPVLDELASEYMNKVDIYKIDIDAEPELANLFGIMSVPSLLFIPMGEEPQMAQGALPKEIIDQAIQEVLKVSP